MPSSRAVSEPHIFSGTVPHKANVLLLLHSTTVEVLHKYKRKLRVRLKFDFEVLLRVLDVECGTEIGFFVSRIEVTLLISHKVFLTLVIKSFLYGFPREDKLYFQKHFVDSHFTNKNENKSYHREIQTVVAGFSFPSNSSCLQVYDTVHKTAQYHAILRRSCVLFPTGSSKRRRSEL